MVRGKGQLVGLTYEISMTEPGLKRAGLYFGATAFRSSKHSRLELKLNFCQQKEKLLSNAGDGEGNG